MSMVNVLKFEHFILLNLNGFQGWNQQNAY